MRRALQGLLAAGLLVTAAGCEDFLTPEPKTFSASSNYYQTPAHFEGAVVTLYGDLRGLFGGNFRTLGDLRGETVSLQFNINVPGFTFQLDEFSEATNDNTVQPQYGSIFNTIFDANVILTRIEGVEFTNQAQKARIIAEAKYVRALAFWQGLQFFGLGESWQPNNLAIPLVLEEITEPQQAFDLERATVQQVYDQIIADLKESIPNLPVRGSAGATGANLGRITRGAAEFLLGATYQLNTPSQEAQNLALAEFRKLAGEGYRLVTAGSGPNNAYRQVFNPSNKNNIESILEIQYVVSSENGDLRQNLAPGMAPLNAIGGGNNGSAATPAVYGASGGGNFNPTQNFILSFAGADPTKPAAPFDLRYEGGYGQFCPNTGGNNTGAANVSGVTGVADVLRGGDPTLGGPNELFPELNIEAVRDPQTKVVRQDCIPYFIKWRWPEHMPQSGRDNNNWIVFRYADALLRIAESAVRVGNQAEAAAALNAVRARAGLPNDEGAVTLADVLQERAWELAGEGYRWFDLKRFGVASSTIQAHGNFRRSIIPRQAAQTDIYLARGDLYRLRYPIRPRDVDLSQCKIKQNPGWTSNAACVGT
jgi:starch-binding outer membrane protein, SusD/RagB family